MAQYMAAISSIVVPSIYCCGRYFRISAANHFSLCGRFQEEEELSWAACLWAMWRWLEHPLLGWLFTVWHLGWNGICAGERCWLSARCSARAMDPSSYKDQIDQSGLPSGSGFSQSCSLFPGEERELSRSQRCNEVTPAAAGRYFWHLFLVKWVIKVSPHSTGGN